MEREDVDLERGDDDIVFIEFGDDIDTSKMIEENDKPRDELIDRMNGEGLEWENARVAAIFRDEFSLHLDDDAEITLNGEQLYP